MNVQRQPWKEQYESERDRLIQEFGWVVDGGILEAIQHVGSTSVPELYGSGCIDIGLAVWPFPLEAGPKSRLEALGYQVVTDYEGRSEQRFRHMSDLFQLYLWNLAVRGGLISS